jgi:hypothetical protein
VCNKSTDYYELSSEDRQVVGLRCRADDLPGTSYEVEEQRQEQRAQLVQPPCNSQSGRVRVHELSKSVLGGSAVLHKTARRSKAAYINQRVNQVSGKAVRTALLEVVTNTRGNSVYYTRTRADTYPL